MQKLKKLAWELGFGPNLGWELGFGTPLHDPQISESGYAGFCQNPSYQI